MANQIFRVVGSGYTTFSYSGQPLLYAQTVAETAPQAVAPPQAVQPLDEPHPIEIAFPKAVGPGQLQLSIFEQWMSEVWDQLPGYSGAADLVDVFQRNIDLGSVLCTKIIKAPSGQTRTIFYHGTVITNIDLNETVNIGAMVFAKGITLQYTHRTRS